jgi:hypothetical protein
MTSVDTTPMRPPHESDHLFAGCSRRNGRSGRLHGSRIRTGPYQISVAHEAGNLNDLRAILGNDIAIRAYRGEKLPFPDGAMIARLPGATTRRRKTRRSLAAPNRLLPASPPMFNLWSRIQKSTRRRAAGDSLNSKTANLPTKHCSKPAFPAAPRSNPGTLSSPVTRPDSPLTPAPCHWGLPLPPAENPAK